MNGQLVILDRGSAVLTVPDTGRRDDMIRYTRIFDNVTVATLAELLEVASRTSELPRAVDDLLRTIARRTHVDTELRPPPPLH